MGLPINLILEGNGLNLSELDKSPCHKCHKSIPIVYRERQRKSGQIVRVRDRSNRVDCDEGEDISKLVTYHKKCWIALIHA